MKKTLLLLTLLISFISYSQTNGITYQAVILNPSEQQLPGTNQANIPLANTTICLQFSILDQNSSVEYQETINIDTDEFGMVNIIIGIGFQTGGYANNFQGILWNNTAKNLKVDLNTNGSCSSFEEISNQPFTFVPFALYALNSENTMLIEDNLLSIIDLQEELDATQTGAGLNADGTYTANTSSNYISTATSLVNATENLDGQLRTNTDGIVTNATTATNAIAAVQTDVNQNETDADTAIAGVQTDVNNNEAASIAADGVLQSNIDTINTDAANIQTELDATQTGAGLNADGTYNANATANYISTSTSIADATENLDAQVKVNADGIITNATDITTNVTGIATNVTDIATNTTDIGNNTTAISTNAAAITNSETVTTNALALKEDAFNKSMDATLASNSDIKFPTEKAVKTYVDTNIASGTATNVSGIVAIVNGGTGSDTQNFVDLTTDQSIAGVKAYSSDVTINALTVGRGAGSAPDNETNTAIGILALGSNTTGSYNTANGFFALVSNTTGIVNTANGAFALRSNTTGFENTANGYNALRSNTTGFLNTANGSDALRSNTTGFENTANGYNALDSNTTGSDNTANGAFALSNNTTGNGNTATGFYALRDNTTGSNNTAVGAFAEVSDSDLNNATAVGFSAVVNASNTIQLGNTNVTNVITSGTLTAGDITYPKEHGTTGQVLSTSGTGTGALIWTTPLATQNFVDLTTDQSIAGVKTFTGTVTATNLSGNNTGDQDLSLLATTVYTNNVFSTLVATIGALEARIAALEPLPASIGDLRAGGVVFWVDPNDNTKGLVCALQDQGRGGIEWYNGSYVTTNATATAIGTGAANTTAIIGAQGPRATDYAAGLARAYTGGGHTNWFLPSRDELNQMYVHKATLEAAAGFTAFGNFYWSSTEYDNRSAWRQNFGVGVQASANKIFPDYVRAVRAF